MVLLLRKLFLLAITFVFLVVPFCNSQRWYLTGHEEGNDSTLVNGGIFAGFTVNLVDIHESSVRNSTSVYYGRTMLNESEPSADLLKNIGASIDVIVGIGRNRMYCGNTNEDMTLKVFDHLGSIDYSTVYRFEIAQWNQEIRELVNHQWLSLRLGSVATAELCSRSSLQHLDFKDNTELDERMHFVTMARDNSGSHFVNTHLWWNRNHYSVIGTGAVDTPKTLRLRVMTYNLWHNNPPEWVFSGK